MSPHAPAAQAAIHPTRPVVAHRARPAAEHWRRPAAALLLVAALAVQLGGCATTAPAGAAAGGAGTASPTAASRVDPWEGFNRRMFAFNDAVDEAVMKPVAEAYRNVVPSFVRTGIRNALGNVRDLWSAANQLLQGKAGAATQMGMRVITNTVFGLGGLLDVATEIRLPRQSEDFGQTLAVWGLGTGPYLVLPLLGPSTLRDAGGLPLDLSVISPSSVPTHTAARVGVTVLGLVDTRAGLLSTTQLIGDVALDRYSFVRDAFLARRLDQVYDGSPPLKPMDDFADEPPAEPAAAASTPKR